MDTDFPHQTRQEGVKRSSNGCWTCRLRRKKCDEKQPVCDTCATLLITCHTGQDKPEWMDGGPRQEAMAEQLKREVKDKAHLRLRRWGRTDQHPGDDASVQSSNGTDPRHELSMSTASSQRGADCTFLPQDIPRTTGFGRSDTVLLMFYLENVLPFLFPFYRPSPLTGGKSWILELMIISPVLRQATLSQSSYFFSVARDTASCQVMWENMLGQTRETFEALGQSLQVISASNILENTHGAVRILASIMQLQRFEIAVLSLNNCRAHLNAAMVIFRQLLGSGSEGFEGADSGARFGAVIDRLGPSTWILPNGHGCDQFPSAEQSAFRFTSALLMFDDIIASTVLQEQPTLYEYHSSLLNTPDVTTEPLVNIKAVIGCHNCVMRLVADIAVLDAWKQRCRKAGNLNMMELVRRATLVQNALEKYLALFPIHATSATDEDRNLLDVFRESYWRQSKSPAVQSTVVTSVWTHAALLYLFVVVSGWQPASTEVSHHVGRILELLETEISPPAMLRTMAWPFCVAGCLAESGQEERFRAMVNDLQPLSVFGTVRKALEIMEEVWRNRSAADYGTRDLAACFRSQGDLVLLV